MTYEAWTTARSRTNYMSGGDAPLRHAYKGSGLALCGIFVSLRHGKHVFDPKFRRACKPCARIAKKNSA